LTIPNPASAAQTNASQVTIHEWKSEDVGALIPEVGTIADEFALTVFFAFDSAALTTQAMRALDRLAPTLLDHLNKSGRVFVEAHSDASGSLAYNIELSAARARAVANYLHSVWGIHPSQLTLRAWGDSELRNRAAPLAAENRRVEIFLMIGAPIHNAPSGMGPNSLSPNHLDIDDFGGARNPLMGANRVPYTPSINERHQ
jgi:outer membrane protein OmpA-like peptidoglycan-associated protein